MDLLNEIAQGIEAGDDERVRILAEEGLAERLPAGDLLQRGLLAGMKVVGDRFKRRDIFLPDVLLAARALYAGLAVLKPHLAGGGAPVLGRVVLGSVQGDLHDIGKNLVRIMLEGAGIEVVDLGHDVPAERFVEAAVAEGVTLIGMSALLTTTMPRMREVVGLLRTRGFHGGIRTIVGGAPVSAEFAREIGADDYAFDAAHAVERVKGLLGVA